MHIGLDIFFLDGLMILNNRIIGTTPNVCGQWTKKVHWH